MTTFRFVSNRGGGVSGFGLQGLGEELGFSNPKVRSLVMANTGCGPCLDFKRDYQAYEKLVNERKSLASFASAPRKPITFGLNKGKGPERALKARQHAAKMATYNDQLAKHNRYKALPAEISRAEERAKDSFSYASEHVLRPKIYNGFVIKPKADIAKGKLVFDVQDPETKQIVQANNGTLEEAKSVVEKIVSDRQRAAVKAAEAARVAATTAANLEQAEADVAADLKVAESGQIPASIQTQAAAAPAETGKKSNLLLYGGLAVAGVAAMAVLNK